MSAEPPPPAGPPPTPQTPGGFDLGAAFSWAWKKFQENAATLIIGTLVLIVASAIVYIVLFLIANALFITDASLDAKSLTVDEGSGFVTRLFVSALTSAIASIVIYLFQANLIRTSLAITSGAKPEIGELFKFVKVDKTLTAAVILAAGTFIGTLLCYLPGILFSIGAAYTLYFLIDKGTEPLESVKQSFSFVIGNIGTLILLILASAATLIVGAILCGVGLLVAIPVVILLNAYAFRSLNGGSVVA
jgi:uncharacterized membrane protein